MCFHHCRILPPPCVHCVCSVCSRDAPPPLPSSPHSPPTFPRWGWTAGEAQVQHAQRTGVRTTCMAGRVSLPLKAPGSSQFTSLNHLRSSPEKRPARACRLHSCGQRLRHCARPGGMLPFYFPCLAVRSRRLTLAPRSLHVPTMRHLRAPTGFWG